MLREYVIDSIIEQHYSKGVFINETVFPIYITQFPSHTSFYMPNVLR